MANLTELESKIQYYEMTYRHPDLEPISDGVLYDLFPGRGDSKADMECRWPKKFPFLNRAGVYVFLNDDYEVLYIGKASMNHDLGSRVGSYCQYDKDGETCKLKHQWEGEPRYVSFYAVPEKTRFEAPSLEEYLISEISTKNNRAGIAK